MNTSDKCEVCGRYGPVDVSLDGILSAYDPTPNKYYSDEPYEWWVAAGTEGDTYNVPGVGYVKLVSKDAEHPDDYGTEECHLVFEVDGNLYKKVGEVSSYNGFEWQPGLKDTYPQTREVIYYA
jgi:hypothetical protein